MVNKQLWEQSVDMIIKSIWIYTIAGILGAIFGAIDGILNPVGFLSAMAGEEGPTGAFGVLDTICQIAVIAGYVLFFLNIKKFVEVQPTEADRAAAKNIYIAYMLLIIGVVVRFIPVIGGIAWLVLVIIGYVKLLSGFKALRDSANMTPCAKNGAGILYKSTIWILVGAVLSIIPFVGRSSAVSWMPSSPSWYSSPSCAAGSRSARVPLKIHARHLSPSLNSLKISLRNKS